MRTYDVSLIAEEGDLLEIHPSGVDGVLFARWRGGGHSVHLSPEQAVRWGEQLLEAGQKALLDSGEVPE